MSAAVMNRDWMVDAVCRRVDPEVFFPSATGHAHEKAVKRAVAVCAACPVQQQCSEYAETLGEPWGVWAGRNRGGSYLYGNTKPRPLMGHGTEARYKRHRLQGEQACPACLEANRRAVARRAAKKKAMA